MTTISTMAESVRRVLVGSRILEVSDLRSYQCYAELKASTQYYRNINNGHCVRLVTWAIDTPSGIVFACNLDYEKFIAKYRIDPDCICRLSDSERDFNELHPGAGGAGRKRKPRD